MHDIRAIRENPAAFDAALARRGDAPVSSDLLRLDESRRAKILAAETAQAEQNKASKEVGAAKGRGDEAEFERLRALVAEKKAEVARMQTEAKDLDALLADQLIRIANLPAEDVPEGADENDNVEINRWGTPRELDFAPKEHFEIDAVQNGMDFETAAKLSGSRFVLLSGGVARIHARFGAVHAGHPYQRERSDRGQRPRSGSLGNDAGHRQVAEIWRRQLSNPRRLVADPNL